MQFLSELRSTAIEEHWIEFSLSNNDCPMESPRVQWSFSAQGYMSQLVLSIHQNPEEVGSITREARVRAGRQRPDTSLFVLCISCHEKVWFRFKVELPTSKHLYLG